MQMPKLDPNLKKILWLIFGSVLLFIGGMSALGLINQSTDKQLTTYKASIKLNP
jgi:hypothetical protein